MKVSDLIRLLEKRDPDAEVLIMSQRKWPFEMAIEGVAVREEMLLAERDAAEDGEAEPRYERDTAPNDLILVEGDQLRYGSKTAWQVAVR